MSYLQENGVYVKDIDGKLIPQADPTTASIDALRSAVVAQTALLRSLSEQVRLGFEGQAERAQENLGELATQIHERVETTLAGMLIQIEAFQHAMYGAVSKFATNFHEAELRDARLAERLEKLEHAQKDAFEGINQSNMFISNQLTARAKEIAAIEAKLPAELEELRQWKREAIAVMPDYQEIGKILGLKWGDTVHDKIIPALRAARTAQSIATCLPTQREIRTALARKKITRKDLKAGRRGKAKR